MRLSRAALLLSKTGLYHRLKRCGAFQTPPSVKHHVLVERLILSHGSKMSWRYKSYAASSPSVSVKDGKSRGRVSRNERKAMVENYVRKYREMKPGMFPTVSDAQKEVGGSYYVVRDIIQELKYKSSIASLEATDPSTGSISEQELPKENLSSIRNKNKRQFRSIGSHSKHGKPEGDATQPCLNDEPTVSLDSENNGSESKLTLQEEEPKSTSKESGVPERDLHQLHVQDLEAPNKSSVWQSLKSFANGILGIWKRS